MLCCEWPVLYRVSSLQKGYKSMTFPDYNYILMLCPGLFIRVWGHATPESFQAAACPLYKYKFKNLKY